MLPESDNVVASMGWVGVLQNFHETRKTYRSPCEFSKKSPSVGSIAGASSSSWHDRLSYLKSSSLPGI
jgi:hypothetical protein